MKTGKTIVIETNSFGIELFEATNKGMIFYAGHLDQLSQLEATIGMLQKRDPESISNSSLKALKILIGFDTLLSITIADLQLIARELYLSKIRLQQVFYIKHAYLVIYETYISFKKKQNLIYKLALNAGPATVDSHENALKGWRCFLKKYKMETSIKLVRQKIAAHIDEDFNLWYSTINDLDAEDTGEIMIAFLAVISSIQNLAFSLIKSESIRLGILEMELKNNASQLITEMEGLVTEINKRQPLDNRLELDFSIFRNY